MCVYFQKKTCSRWCAASWTVLSRLVTVVMSTNPVLHKYSPHIDPFKREWLKVTWYSLKVVFSKIVESTVSNFLSRPHFRKASTWEELEINMRFTQDVCCWLNSVKQSYPILHHGRFESFVHRVFHPQVFLLLWLDSPRVHIHGLGPCCLVYTHLFSFLKEHIISLLVIFHVICKNLLFLKHDRERCCISVSLLF